MDCGAGLWTDQGEHGFPTLDCSWHRECQNPMVADLHSFQSQEALQTLADRRSGAEQMRAESQIPTVNSELLIQPAELI